MIEVTVAREIASPAPPNSRHFDAPRWWPEWIAQVLAADRPSVGTPAPVQRTPAARPGAAPHRTARPATARCGRPTRVAAPADTASLEAAFAAAAGALREALRHERDAVADADAWAAAAAGHEVHLARRALRALLDAAAGPGPGTRLEWCSCHEERAAR